MQRAKSKCITNDNYNQSCGIIAPLQHMHIKAEHPDVYLLLARMSEPLHKEYNELLLGITPRTNLSNLLEECVHHEVVNKRVFFLI